MIRLQGIAVSPGVAIGEALVVDNEGFRIPRRFLPRDAIEREILRLAKAIDETTAEINESRRRISERLGDDYGSIFSAHAQMVNDRKLRGELEELIRDRHYSAEYSVSRVLRRYAKVFQSLEGAYMAERANDIFDIEKRLLRRLLGEKREELAQVSSEVLVLARNLTPSETAAMKPEFIRGFATETGGPGSHTAIVAEGLGIPAVVGTGAFLSDVSGGETVIIDGDEGLVILRPDEETVARYRHEVAEQKTLAAKLDELSDKPCETLDGERIQLLGNIEFPAETKLCMQRGVDGIGLYRTEFLFLTGDSIPTEEQHYAAYREVAEAMEGRPVVMRTLDLGADKLPLFPAPDDERNPFLGLRSIRLALKHVDIFRMQLRAILRASAVGDVRVMFPLVSNVIELRRARMVLADAMEDLEEEGVEFDRHIKVGMMVEVPAAVVMMDHFVHEVDFFSIGTNDLVQYTLAVDRSNKDVASLYTSADPSVIRLVKMAVDAAGAGGKPISLCGQMSGAPLYTMLLLGLGLRSLSVTPSAAPEVKRVVRSTTIDHCKNVAARVLSLESARDIKTYLREELSKLLPDQPV
ncbi:phosphoenolpyruvate--protein phosphotransferase [Botrimarina mediterranea]|uniref:Phosphoenolpyruvate-protein phosphotransferase n=1 Tax=Botrimarina mediterranea TaxID=2528022 RepID=A0A518KED8_9BACT|nr:phosphoenolpyruvate--protein phosphotransferase [Botrimarina mediterranea]QDV76164.1 Phosphoenolpyruvate-protein phosphotransferase [Botrimarina mediterranea]QDV80761.1 Phosphoenolpyruvate-protein phosphotransferase [Planctomycetes bacterium K2D]